MPFNNQSKEETEEKGRDKRERLGIGTWNVRSLNKEDKLIAIKREMERYRLNILGISETHVKGKEDEESDGMMIIKSGDEQSQRRVAIIFDKEAAKRITEVEKYNDRTLIVKVSAAPVDMIIMQVYMPTMDHEDDEMEQKCTNR